MACPGSFLSCHKENDPDSNSVWDLDPGKPVWSTFCQEYVTNPSFSHTFLVFVTNSTTFATDHILGYWVGSSGIPL